MYPNTPGKFTRKIEQAVANCVEFMELGTGKLDTGIVISPCSTVMMKIFEVLVMIPQYKQKMY